MQNCRAKHWPSRCLQLSGLLFSASSHSLFESFLPRSGHGKMSPLMCGRWAVRGVLGLSALNLPLVVS